VLGQEGRTLPPPAQVIGIEIYKAGDQMPITAPLWAQGCAEVVVWTRAMLDKS
jgi:hypothetical protein